MLLRYPGGKSRGEVATKLLEVIEARLDEGFDKFCEPFFGGGGITFALLKHDQSRVAKGLSRRINHLIINDLDPSIECLWTAVVKNHEELIEQVRGCALSKKGFHDAKDRIKAADSTALDTLIVNRLSHGGRGVRGGLQGGENQTGEYKIGCRWSVPYLCKGIQIAHDLLTAPGISLWWNSCRKESYEHFLTESFADYLLYLDPPYFKHGNELYQHSFGEDDHKVLSGELIKHYRRNKNGPGWVLSYDNDHRIRWLYEHSFTKIKTSNIGNIKVRKKELIFTSFKPADKKEHA